jgi:hypothetical protein
MQYKRSLRSVLLICLVFCVLLLCIFTFWVPCCNFRIRTMVGSFLPPVVCKRAHVLLAWFVFVYGQWCPTHIVFALFLFLFDFYSLSCVTCNASFYGLSILCYHYSILYRLLTLAHYMLSKCNLYCIISLQLRKMYHFVNIIKTLKSRSGYITSI